MKDHHVEEGKKIIESLRSDIFKEFCNALKLNITPEVKLECAKSQIKQERYNDAALLIIKEKFHDHFDIKELMLKLTKENKLETVKLLIQNEDETMKKNFIYAMSNES